MRPKIFIASPLFNPPQIKIIKRIETLLAENGFDFYSARLHSGSDKMTPEQKKDLRVWDPVFQSNIRGLDECRVMIAVLEYALPEGESIKRHFPYEEAEDEMGRTYNEGKDPIQIELPDAGTVWECGYHRAQGKIVFGFHSDRAKHLNLMLSHGCDALVKGWDNLERLLSGEAVTLPVQVALCGQKSDNPDFLNDAFQFDWSATESWDAAAKEVE